MKYFTLEYTVKLHEDVIKRSGGLSGINNIGQLDSVLHHIKNDDYYPTFVDKLTHLIYSVVQFHVFLDGNKRTSILLGVQFLNLNQYSYASDQFIQEMEDVVVKIAEDKISKEQLRNILISLLD